MHLSSDPAIMPLNTVATPYIYICIYKVTTVLSVIIAVPEEPLQPQHHTLCSTLMKPGLITEPATTLPKTH